MTRDSQTEQKPRPQQKSGRHNEDDGPKVRDRRSQGIVRDERGQEQPADKRRAQQVNKSEQR